MRGTTTLAPVSPAALPPTTTAGPSVTAADGTRLATWDLGGEGPALVLLHATGFHGRCYVPLADALAGAFHCYAVDQRGQGSSDPSATGSYDWHLFADDLLAVLDRLELEDPFAFGHSMGGAAALMAEAKRPGTFPAIFGYEPIVFTPAQAAVIRAENSLVDLSRRRRAEFPSLGDAILNYAGKPPFAGFRADVLWQYVNGGFAVGDDGTATLRCAPEHESLIYQSSGSSGAFEQLPAVKASVVLACGADNPDISEDHLVAIAAPLRDASVEVLAGLSHFGPFEDPVQVAGLVAATLLPGPSGVDGRDGDAEGAVRRGRGAGPGHAPGAVEGEGF